jgi:hypothetical protein
MSANVWYAAYGSNLSRERFDVYLLGGRPAGASHAYPGCRDRSPPLDDVADELDTQLAFGGYSQTWGGGVAFVRDTPNARAKVRLYRITLEQFADVVAQENWLVPGTVLIEPSTEQVVLDGDHTYRLVIPLGVRDGVPVMTVSQLAAAEVAEPTSAYLRHIAVGLRESHAMSSEDVVDYLVRAPGAPAADVIRSAVS